MVLDSIVVEQIVVGIVLSLLNVHKVADTLALLLAVAVDRNACHIDQSFSLVFVEEKILQEGKIGFLCLVENIVGLQVLVSQ